MAITINGSSNTISGLAVGGLPDGIVDTDMIAANAVTAAKRGTGAILQVVQGSKTSRSAFTGGGAFQDIGLKCNLTPSSASNKVLVIITLQCTTNLNTPGFIVLARGGSDIAEGDSSTFTQLGLGDAEGNRSRCGALCHEIDNDNDLSTHVITYLDSPNSTNAVHYETYVYTDGSGFVYVNGTKANSDNSGHGRAASTITAMEIAG